ISYFSNTVAHVLQVRPSLLARRGDQRHTRSQGPRVCLARTHPSDVVVGNAPSLRPATETNFPSNGPMPSAIRSNSSYRHSTGLLGSRAILLPLAQSKTPRPLWETTRSSSDCSSNPTSVSPPTA